MAICQFAYCQHYAVSLLWTDCKWPLFHLRSTEATAERLQKQPKSDSCIICWKNSPRDVMVKLGDLVLWRTLPEAAKIRCGVFITKLDVEDSDVPNIHYHRERRSGFTQKKTTRQFTKWGKETCVWGVRTAPCGKKLLRNIFVSMTKWAFFENENQSTRRVHTHKSSFDSGSRPGSQQNYSWHCS